MNNLSEFFCNEQEYYLDFVSYTRIDQITSEPELELKCTDTIKAKICDDRVVITVTRELNFNPEALFKLAVSYGVILRFIPEKKNEVDWNNIDLAKEFQENGMFATGNLFNRISLLVGEITSSFGQSPIIVPPQFTT